ncbi:hypothetical protein SRABI118_03363 [Massilia sp. Bi118]|uniref:glycine-rich domain-containing protein n=1 Tax=Massilia sp. Bi118 TaxID=2822346 RepID=UPI001DD00087|nr:hypothetical protein [Massilia sp. Bi118]CAH0266401.1 hypothetical protein SRABI118_03363 [Massilia sp. Bi118]
MNANDQFKAVMELDLEPIKVKLMHVESGEGWSLEQANAVEKEYRRFLCLMKKYPQADTAPLVDVDTFWHYHILDTMKYATDCERVFGYFLHHYPYVGMGGESDEQVRVDSGERMRELYEATFGETYPALRADIAGQASAYCGAAVKADSAYCGAAVKMQTAYCGAAVKAATAYCGAAVKAQTAYCGAAVKAETAYCGAATKAQTAYCGAAVKTDVAYCGAAVKAATAYCGAAVKASTAYCGAAITTAASREAKTALAA